MTASSSAVPAPEDASPPLSKKKALAILAHVPEDAKRATLCALVGHSRIMTYCFGYWSCARCAAQIGDSIAGVFDGKDKVLVGHKCETCVKNAASLTWRDTLLAPDPFPAEEPTNAE
mgnify:FL=1